MFLISSEYCTCQFRFLLPNGVVTVSTRMSLIANPNYSQNTGNRMTP